MIFFDDGTDEKYYKHINKTILDANVMNMSLIITEGKYVAIDTDDSSFHAYYIIKFHHLHIPFNKTLVLMAKLFFLVKWYVKELISLQ